MYYYYCKNTTDNNNNAAYIDGRIYLTLFKSSAAGLKALKPVANGRYVRSVHITALLVLLTLTVQKYIYLFVII